MAGAAAATATAIAADMVIAVDTQVAAMLVERVDLPAPPAVDMLAEHAVTQVRLAAADMLAAAPAVDLAAAVMPVAASVAATAVAAAMAVADTGN
jgi:hypothetical protein